MRITKRVNPMIFILVLALVVALVIAGPLAGIWALNTLFPQLAVPYDVWTWLAMFFVLAVLSPRVKIEKS